MGQNRQKPGRKYGNLNGTFHQNEGQSISETNFLFTGPKKGRNYVQNILFLELTYL